MNEQRKKRISKFLSLILRHKPQLINLILDENGWASVENILANDKLKFTFMELDETIQTNDKQRFSFNEDKTKIRANQGHSLDNIDLDLEPQSPPEFLYHGTVAKFIASIKENGLLGMKRQHVHLSFDKETAVKVGNRRGKAIILSIKAKAMYDSGYNFYLSENGVWLTNDVPPKFINFTG